MQAFIAFLFFPLDLKTPPCLRVSISCLGLLAEYGVYALTPPLTVNIFQHVFRMAEIFVDVHYLQPDIFGEIGRRADVMSPGNSTANSLPLCRATAVPADRCIDNLRHTLECQVALFVAVKLVIQLEIVQIRIISAVPRLGFSL